MTNLLDTLLAVPTVSGGEKAINDKIYRYIKIRNDLFRFGFFCGMIQSDLFGKSGQKSGLYQMLRLAEAKHVSLIAVVLHHRD